MVNDSIKKAILCLSLLSLPLPLFFNCHRGVDLASTGEAEEPVQQVVGFDPSGATSELPEQAKVQLDPTILEKGFPTSALIAGSVHSKAIGEEELLIPGGRRILVRVNNECLSEREELNSFQGKALPDQLSERALELSGQAPLESLDEQAYGFVVPGDLSVREIATLAETDECVEHVTHDDRQYMLAQANFTVNDPLIQQQRHLISSNANSIDPTKLWNLAYTSSKKLKSEVTVAIVDTGILLEHEDLAARIWRDRAGNPGRNFDSATPLPNDDNGHGTHVAGLVAAIANNGVGVSGIAPLNVRLMPVKALDNAGAGTISAVANAIRWATSNGADVINLSLTLPGQSTELLSAIQAAANAGAVVIVAAGNAAPGTTGRELNGSTFVLTPSSQASTIPGAIAVGSIDASTTAKSDFSHYSSTLIEISAPGSDGTGGGILSTWHLSNEKYRRLAGTSMATPLVAGAAALSIGILKSEGITASNVEIISLLKDSAKRNPQLTSYFVNGAMLSPENLARLIETRYLIQADGVTEEP